MALRCHKGAQLPRRGADADQIVALGDSLTAGYGLADKDGFVPRLQAALAPNGIAAEIANAGVSGDTAADGLARLDWSVPQGTDAVIVELGANDMLRGIKPEVTRDALDAILHRLTRGTLPSCCAACARRPISAPSTVGLSSASIPIWRPNTACCSIRSFSTASPPISISRSPTACIPTRPAST